MCSSRKHRTARASTAGLPRAFTLAELLVVVAVIAVLAVIAVPVFRSVNLSGQFSQVQATFSSLVTAAQIPSYEQPAGLFVMRASRHPDLPPGPNADEDEDNPFLNVQEVRVVVRKPFPDSPFVDEDIPEAESLKRPYFRPEDGTRPERLGELTWVAPDYAADSTPGDKPVLKSAEFEDERLMNPYARYPAGTASSDSESLLNTFFILYDRGECVPMQRDPNVMDVVYAVANERDLVYVGAPNDPSYRWDGGGALWVNHASAGGLLVYSRMGLIEQFATGAGKTAEARWDYLRTQAAPLYCGRYGGTVLRGTPARSEQ